MERPLANDLKKREEDDEDFREREPDDADAEDDGIHGPSEEDLADRPEAVMYCPNCRNEVFFDAEQCGVCGHYLTNEETGEMMWEPPKPWWARVLAGIALAVVLLCVAGLVVMLFRGF